MKSLSEQIHDAAVGLRQILFPGPVSQEAFIGDSNTWEAHLVAEAAQFAWNISRERARQECGTSSAAAAVNSCERAAMADTEIPTAGNQTKINAMLAERGPELDAALAEVVQFTGDGTMEMNPDVWPSWVREHGDLFDQMNTAFDTEPLGDRILVVSYGRDGRTVASHMRSRPRSGDGLGGMLSDKSVVIYGGNDVQPKTSTAVRHGEHASEAPPHMLTDVRFELVRLDERTPDGRLIVGAGFGVRDLPLSFSALFTTAHGMPGEAVIVGSMDEVTVEPDGRVWGQGWLLDEPDARRTGRLLQAGALRGNSVELSASKVALSLSEDDELLQDYVESKLSATTVVANPAMEQCTVTLNDTEFDFGETAKTEANAMAGEMANFTDLAPAVFTATASVVERPAAYNFATPEFTGPSPVREVEGLVQGHVCLWDNTHLGDSQIRPPRSATDYAYFATGEVLTDEGPVATGRLIIGSDHPDLSLDWRSTLDEYAATCLAWADVAIGEDQFGIWVSGIVRPGVDDTVLHAARASGVSGDWRRIGGNLELVAVLSVNAPGFPVPRAFKDGDRMTAMAGFGMEQKQRVVTLEEAIGNLNATTETLAPMARHFEAERLVKRHRAEIRAEVADILDKI